MGSIEGRLRLLEEQGHRGRCAGCGLRPQDGAYVVAYGNDPAAHVLEVCPECGRSTKVHIRVVYDGEEGEGGVSYGAL
jgi:hypothetical protein